MLLFNYAMENGKVKLSQQPKHMSNGNKKQNFLEVNAINNSAKFQLYSPYRF